MRRDVVGHRSAVGAPAERRVRPVVDERAFHRLGQGRETAEVAVVALALTRQCRPHGMVHVVTPLRVQAEPTGIAGGHQPRVVEVGFGDHEQRPPLLGGEPVHRDGDLLKEVDGPAVGKGMHSVQPQAVAVVVA